MGIVIGDVFIVDSNQPLDNRMVVANATERDAIKWFHRYEGLLVYQKDNNNLYICTDPGATDDGETGSATWALVTTSTTLPNAATQAAISGAFNGVTGSFLTSSPFTANAISGAFNGVTGSFLTSSPFTVAAISGAFFESSKSLASRVAVVESGVSSSPFTSDSISGSFTIISESLAQRASNQESRVFVSPFTSDGISGSFFESSESLASRVTAVEESSITLPDGLISGSDHIFTSITSSGNISASGLLFISASTTATALNTLMYDIATGQVYYTGSYGGGGNAGNGAGFPFTGSADISGSLTVTGPMEILAPTASTTDHLFLVRTTDSDDSKFVVNLQGVTVLGAFDNTPTAVAGGMFYSSSGDFYLGS